MLEIKARDVYKTVHPEGVEASRDVFTKAVTLRFTADNRIERA